MNERMNESPKEPTNARHERRPRTHPQPPQTPYHPQGGVIGTNNILRTYQGYTKDTLSKY